MAKVERKLLEMCYCLLFDIRTAIAEGRILSLNQEWLNTLDHTLCDLYRTFPSHKRGKKSDEYISREMLQELLSERE